MRNPEGIMRWQRNRPLEDLPLAQHGRMQQIAWITQPWVLKQVLNGMNQKAEPPP